MSWLRYTVFQNMRLLTHLWNPKLAPKLADPGGGGRTRWEVKIVIPKPKKIKYQYFNMKGACIKLVKLKSLCNTQYHASFNILPAPRAAGIHGALDRRPFLTGGNLTNLWNPGPGYIDFGRDLTHQAGSRVGI